MRLPPAIESAETTVTAFVGVSAEGPPQQPAVVKNLREFQDAFGAGINSLATAVRLFFDNGGRHALVVRVGSPGVATDDDLSSPELHTDERGIWSLEPFSFSLLCVPPLAEGPAGEISGRSRRAAVEICRRHRAFFVADPLLAWTTAEAALTGPLGLDSEAWGLPRDAFAAVYMPYLVAQGVDGTPAAAAPCGAVAGVIVRTDLQRGVWKAPAGAEARLTGIAELTRVVGRAAQERLNSAGINVLRSFPDVPASPHLRHVVWGARTLVGDDGLASEWKYVNVRRLASHVERSIDEGTRWAVSEPNGEPLWADLRRAVGTFLTSLFRAGAFAGATEREAWFVKCDRQTTTQADIDAGRLNIVVGIAPVKPAEFIVLEIGARAGPPDD